MVTINDVAELAGLSTSTVSRVVSRHGSVSKESRQKVDDAIKALNYTPNTVAQALKNKKSNIIGVVVPDVSSPYFASMLKGIETAVEKVQMNMLVCSGHAEKKKEIRAVESLLGNRCDALILHLEESLTDLSCSVKSYFRTDVPIILIGYHKSGHANHSVSVDNETGGYLATDYLIKKGHTNIIHISGQLIYKDSRDRLTGYKRALKDAGIRYSKKRVIEGSFSEETGYNAIEHLLNNNSHFTAVFAGDDEIAAGAVEALRNHDLSVPDNISIIGFDDMFHARFMHPKLTTIRQPVNKIGEYAGKTAIKLISGKKK